MLLPILIFLSVIVTTTVTPHLPWTHVTTPVLVATWVKPFVGSQRSLKSQLYTELLRRRSISRFTLLVYRFVFTHAFVSIVTISIFGFHLCGLLVVDYVFILHYNYIGMLAYNKSLFFFLQENK